MYTELEKIDIYLLGGLWKEHLYDFQNLESLPCSTICLQLWTLNFCNIIVLASYKAKYLQISKQI